MSKRLIVCFFFIISMFAFSPLAFASEPHTVMLAAGSVTITTDQAAGLTIAQGSDSFVVSSDTPIIIDGTGTGPSNKSNTVTVVNNSLDPLEESEITITLKNAYIDASDTIDGCAFFIGSNVKCNLFLQGESMLKSGVRRAALEVSGAAPKASLAVSGTGTLNAYGGELAIGIGSGFDGAPGNIEIKSGTFNIHPSITGRCIGSSLFIPCEIIISGGSFKSYSSSIDSLFSSQPKNEAGATLSEYMITGLPGYSTVDDITVSVSGSPISYGKPAQTHDDGTLRLFLPEGTKDITLRVDGVDYTVDIVHVARKNPNDASVKTPQWDKYDRKDLEIDLYLNGAELSGVTINSSIALAQSDYLLSGNILKIKHGFLSGLETGDYSIKIVASSGNSPVVSVNLKDTTDEHYSLRLLTVPDTIITVYGYIHNDAVLSIQQLEEGSDLYDVLKTAADKDHGIIYAHDITLVVSGDVPAFLSDLEVAFLLGDLYDGQNLRIVHLSGNELKTYPVVGKNGSVTVTISRLSPMGVIVPLEDFEPYGPLPQAGQSVIPLVALAALGCIVVVLSIVLYKRKRDV